MEITLSRNSWHRRLQESYFGRVEYANFCPYFWLTIFCVLTSPVVFGFRAVRWLLLKGLVTVVAVAWAAAWPVIDLVGTALLRAFEWLFDALDATVCLPAERVAIGNFYGDEDVAKLYDSSRDYWMRDFHYSEERAMQALLNCAKKGDRKRAARLDAKFQVWKALIGASWAAELDRILARRIERGAADAKAAAERQRLAETERAEAEKRRRESMNRLVGWTKAVAPALLGVAALVALWLGWKLILLGIRSGAWAAIGKVLLLLVELPFALIYLFASGFWDTLKVIWEVCQMCSRREQALGLVLILSAPALLRLGRKCDLSLPPLLRWVAAVARLLGRPLDWLIVRMMRAAQWVEDFLKFMVEGFKMWKKDHCPQINWTE